ncbi:PP2C family serine/threonine-protein phosphatase [Legionella shakespearei]|uniref:Protein phosphatase 2C n=1 Tax=Legionella shakespearei DSM 23087 TaxID=1122169 RepID=A0A0W0YKE2_9GAMM|nr:PP2C family protein-serine/threonine phosphatase [Legionella shakespearei]KTD57275.1 Protein phosphatase 2C [Legionella shakespearei DSM 23087]
MPHIISKPQNIEENVSGINKEYHFGYYETANFSHRDAQEDALAWHVLENNELTAANTTTPLSPEEIGHRLWTSYQLLEKPELKAGTTASTTVYDGKGNLITATLADAASFAAVYDEWGQVLGVVRLNSVTHKPTNLEEKTRIEAAGGFIFLGRVNGTLAVSRAIGDNSLKQAGVCSEAQIDITSTAQIADRLNIAPEKISKIQIITTCDGFTDGAGSDQSKQGHEQYLFRILRDMSSPGNESEEALAQELVEQAKRDGSRDNISVAIQTITKETPPFLMGVYDGHGGTDASCHVADNIGSVFKAQCALTPEAYAQQELSVNKKKAVYDRDNGPKQTIDNDAPAILPAQTPPLITPVQPDAMPEKKPETLDLKQEQECSNIVSELLALTQKYQADLHKRPEKASINPVISHLVSLLKSKSKQPEDKIKDFYAYLDSAQTSFISSEPLTNMDIIKKDTHVSALNFLKGIAIIAATVLTGILPGLLIAGIVYAATGRQPFDLFKSEGARFEKEVHLLKDRHAFFRPEPKAEESKTDAPNPDSGNQLG